MRAPEHTLTTISGKPRERGHRYGQAFKDAIGSFLENEIYAVFPKAGQRFPREDLRRYAAACGEQVLAYSPVIMEELEGIAEGAGLGLEEVLLINLHEELGHLGVLPACDHCTAIAAGPTDTIDGHTYVGQTYDWLSSMHGASRLVRWERPEGPSIIAYGYPGLWASVGMNSAGIALCATSAWEAEPLPGPRVGIPYYVLSAQMLYQETLAGAIEEARRAKQAGWCSMLLADAHGQLASVEVTPREVAVEMGRGHMVRHQYGSRQITRTPEGQEVAHNERTRSTYNLLVRARGKLDRAALQAVLADPEIGRVALDLMLFDTTRCEAHVSRGPGHLARWKTFRFDDW